MRDRRAVFMGEGMSVSVGNDGPTACVVIDSTTALDHLEPDDVSEQDWRSAHTLLRFADVQARDDFISAQDWQVRARQGGRAVPRGDLLEEHLDGLVSLSMTAGMTNSEVHVSATCSGQQAIGKFSIALPARGVGIVSANDESRVGALTLPMDQWARFVAEMRLLDDGRWTRYEPQAVDGLRWTYSRQPDGPDQAGGYNAYPPVGAGPEQTPEFIRLQLAVERLIGRQLWPGYDARAGLQTISDEDDRTQHLLLHALRCWAAEFEDAGGDPMAIRETAFEQTLAPHLRALVATRTQVQIKGLLDGWPGVGSLDVELLEGDEAAWVELKWAKKADTLHNSVWDTAKLAQAIREHAAGSGYLVAGAPEAQWNKNTAYRRLFDVSCHHDTQLLTEYASSWRAWHAENTRTFPKVLPTPIITLPVGDVRFNAPDGEQWIIRVALVHALGTGTYSPLDYPQPSF